MEIKKEKDFYLQISLDKKIISELTEVKTKKPCFHRFFFKDTLQVQNQHF